MKHLAIIILISVSGNISAQNYDSLMHMFLKIHVLGDTIDLSTLAERPILIDTTECIYYSDKFTNPRYFLRYDTTIQQSEIEPYKFNKEFLLTQIEKNNQFNWNQLNHNYFSLVKETSKRKRKRVRKKGRVNYSLPIFIDETKIVMYYFSYFGPLMASMTIDYWEWENGVWKKSQSEIIWMS